MCADEVWGDVVGTGSVDRPEFDWSPRRGSPWPVLVTTPSQSVHGTAHGTRTTRHGDQTLVCVEGHFMWVGSTHVARRPGAQE